MNSQNYVDSAEPLLWSMVQITYLFSLKFHMLVRSILITPFLFKHLFPCYFRTVCSLITVLRPILNPFILKLLSGPFQSHSSLTKLRIILPYIHFDQHFDSYPPPFPSFLSKSSSFILLVLKQQLSCWFGFVL